MRATIDIDPVVLAAVRERQRKEGKSLGAMVSELLAVALAQDARPARREFHWPSAPMASLRADPDDVVLAGPPGIPWLSIARLIV